jgi:hemerythrin-like domain-containing protein
MPQVMTRLHEEHRHIAELLKALERQLARFDAADEEPDYDILTAIADYFVGFPDRCHHPKEDLIFRRMCEIDPGLAEATDLPDEHVRLGAEARRFQEAVENVLKEVEVPRQVFHETATRFIEHQRSHLLMEEQTFFPKALETLSDADWDAIDGQIVDEDDPVFGQGAGGEFAALHDDILKWQAESDRAKG